MLHVRSHRRSSVERLYAYLWDPNGKRVTDRQESSPGVTIGYCAQQPGAYHVQIKVADAHGQYRAALNKR